MIYEVRCMHCDYHFTTGESSIEERQAMAAKHLPDCPGSPLTRLERERDESRKYAVQITEAADKFLTRLDASPFRASEMADWDELFDLNHIVNERRAFLAKNSSQNNGEVVRGDTPRVEDDARARGPESACSSNGAAEHAPSAGHVDPPSSPTNDRLTLERAIAYCREQKKFDPTYDPAYDSGVEACVRMLEDMLPPVNADLTEPFGEKP